MNWIRILSLWIVVLAASCSTSDPATESFAKDGGDTVLPDLSSQEGSTSQPIPCGKGTCPNSNYICCQNNKDAPPECCLKGYNTCYSGGGGITGWPPYNGCNVTSCLAAKPKHCPAGTRGTCCKQSETCGSAWGIAFCEDKSCPPKNKCNGGKLCCSKPGICKSFKNVEYCDEPCDPSNQVKCSLQGKHYGTEQSMHLCCPKGECYHHPDGWPFCLNEAY